MSSTTTTRGGPTLSWDDVLEVGQGGPGCGLLYIDGRQPKGHFRYLPPALLHDGRVYASTFVPGGFILCAIDPATLNREEISARLPYAKLVSIDGDELTYIDHHEGISTARHPLISRTPFFTKLVARLTGRG